MLGLFLPAALWVSWEVLCGNSWSLASGPDSLGWNGVGTQQGFVLVSAFLMLPALKLGYLCYFNLQGKSLSCCCLGEDVFAFASSKEQSLLLSFLMLS